MNPANLPPLNHDDIEQIKSMIARLRRMEKREHHHRDHGTPTAASIRDCIRELLDLIEWIESRL